MIVNELLGYFKNAFLVCLVADLTCLCGSCVFESIFTARAIKINYQSWLLHGNFIQKTDEGYFFVALTEMFIHNKKSGHCSPLFGFRFLLFTSNQSYWGFPNPQYKTIPNKLFFIAWVTFDLHISTLLFWKIINFTLKMNKHNSSDYIRPSQCHFLFRQIRDKPPYSENKRIVFSRFYFLL